MEQQITTSIIAASAALSGVIISQIISLTVSFLDKRHKKHILLRQKYEELMFNFQESLQYMHQVGTCKTLDQLIQQGVSIPAQRTMGLALLYFPVLVPSLETYVKALHSYYTLVIYSFDINNPLDAGQQARVNDKKKYEDVKSNLFESKTKIISELKANVKKYTKA